MSIGTLFTLFVVPAFYTVLAQDRRKSAPAGDAQPDSLATAHIS
jgi:multidrug efflux pump